MTSQTPSVEPQPLGRLQAAMVALDGLSLRPTAGHVAAFDQVHAALTDALSAIDEV